ncbi:hypothetical protein [Brevundimonas sp.]|uniref:hypothetical protein n=1 Tax=Brevundimonas sp. TaxID=1871086 RepID=UPI002D7556EC|nr:hypothetical protein [Brevundimonas sp.]HYD29202.1 hypothetical protein [Brevundimonas sp.]
MAIKTYEQQLESVQAAIAEVEGGAQSYEMDGRTLTRGDLATLYAREERLLGLVRRGTAGVRFRRGAMVG